jgi:hypothetical protein
LEAKRKIGEKKKLQTRYSEIEIDKSHKFLAGKKYDKISPFLQEKMVYAIQKRMKQSGQRWSRKRAQFVLNLRTCFMSDKWNKVVELIRYSGNAA